MLEDTKPKTQTDLGYTIKALRSKKNLGQCFGVKYVQMHGMCMIEYKNSNRNRILKAQVVFPCQKIQSQRLEWTSAIPSNLLRSNKKLGLCFGVKYDFMSCVWLSIRSRTANRCQKQKQWFHARIYKAKDSYRLRNHHQSFRKQEEAWLVFCSQK